jgi:hypothetical protein
MKKTAITIILIGLVITMITGFDFVTREKVVDIGDLEISANKRHAISWTPYVGIVVMAAGACVYLFGAKKTT